MLRGPLEIGSGLVVSPVATMTQPRSSIPLVKKSPRRRSSPVATHVVPFWQMLLSREIGRPAAFVEKTCGALPSAPSTVALITLRSAFSHARSARLLVSYQTTFALPGSPAMTHGHSTRWVGGAATTIGVDQCSPRSAE